MFGVSAVGGYLFPGTVTGDRFEVQTDWGGVGRIAVDVYPISHLSIGAYALYANASSAGQPDEELGDGVTRTYMGDGLNARFAAVGCTAKGAYGDPNVFQARLGLAVAYQMTDAVDWVGNRADRRRRDLCVQRLEFRAPR